MAMTSTNNEIYLPGEIVFEILLRLPVKLLVRFKCVCKSWSALIENPDFVTSHYGQEHNRERLLIWHSSGTAGGYHALSLDVTLSKYEEAECLWMPNDVYDLMGPVNGIYCVISRGWRRMALWNPARKQFRPIPCSINIQWQFQGEAIGFGMDSSSGEYKVVRIRSFWIYKEDRNYYPSVVSVYSSRSNSWRQFEDELVVGVCYPYRCWRNKCLNGILYSFAVSRRSNTSSIIAFDMSSETLQEIKVPDCIKNTEVIYVYGDSIALLSQDYVNRFSAWVMDDGCWVKKISMGPFKYTICAKPLGVWNNSKVLLGDGGSDLDIFNVNTKELRSVESLKKECEIGCSIDSVNFYKESLFSLEVGGHKCVPFDVSFDVVKDFLKSP